jgi:hypothetical protein
MFLINSAFVGKKNFILIQMHGRTTIKRCMCMRNFTTSPIVTDVMKEKVIDKTELTHQNYYAIGGVSFTKLFLSLCLVGRIFCSKGRHKQPLTNSLPVDKDMASLLKL